MSFETSVSAKDEVTQCRIRRKLCSSHAKTQLASFSRFDRCTQTQTWTQSHSIYRTNIAVKCAVDGGPTLNRWCLQWPCGPVDRVMLPMVGLPTVAGAQCTPFRAWSQLLTSHFAHQAWKRLLTHKTVVVEREFDPLAFTYDLDLQLPAMYQGQRSGRRSIKWKRTDGLEWLHYHTS